MRDGKPEGVTNAQTDKLMAVWLSVAIVFLAAAFSSAVPSVVPGMFSLPEFAKLFLLALPKFGLGLGLALLFDWCLRRYGWKFALLLSPLAFLPTIWIVLSNPMDWAAHLPQLTVERIRSFGDSLVVLSFIFGMVGRDTVADLRKALQVARSNRGRR